MVTGSERPPSVGDRIGGYRIDDVLGVGGMGAVYRAIDPRLGRPVALKLMRGPIASDPTLRARFEREAAVLARVDSPHVIAIFEQDEHAGSPYLVTEFVEGGDLGRYLARHGRLAPPVAADVCAQVADALAAAHDAGVVHRDVKPANVLLRDHDLDRPHVYLADFGIAHDDGRQLTSTGEVPGTWGYLAPERSQGAPAAPAADIYALGCLLWEALTGSPPYGGAPVQVLLAHAQAPVPQLRGTDPWTVRANEVLTRVLAKDPVDRPRTAAELRDELRRLATGRQPATRPRRRRALAAAAAAAILAVGSGIGAGALFGGDHEEPSEAPSASPPPPPVNGDIDGDGFGDVKLVDVDRSVNGRDDSTVVYRSDGGELSRSADATDGLPAYVIGDIDGDGTLESMVGDGLRTREVVRIVDGHQAGISIPIPNNIRDTDEVLLFVGDFDGNGRDDVAQYLTSTDRAVQITVSLSQDDDSWAPAEIWLRADWDVAGATTALTAGDFDADGDDDLIVVPGDGTTRLLESDGTGFQPSVAGIHEPNNAPLPNWLATGDFDGDGIDDLLYPAARQTGADDQWVVVVRKLVDDTWTREEWRHDATSTEVEASTVSDVNGDGMTDVVLLVGNRILVGRSNGAGSFDLDASGPSVDRRWTAFVGPVG